MKAPKFIHIASAISIGCSNIFTASFAQGLDTVDAFTTCSNETEHTKLYDYGKRLAEGWEYWVIKEAKDEKQYPVKTKYSFFTRAMLGLTYKYKIPKTDIVYHCYLGYNTTAKDVPWSSVHQGMVDYLPRQSKVKFLSLPER
jgi:hypothetical protein